jgi:hypothetical protein
MLLLPKGRTGEAWEPAKGSAISEIGQLWTKSSVSRFWVPAGDEDNLSVFLGLPKCIVKVKVVR